MFAHNFKYSLKILLKNKSLLFWSLVFPIILGTLFKLAFSNIENSETFNIIDIAVVNNSEINSFYKETIKSLSSNESENQIFTTKYVTLNEAKTLLNDKKISAYIQFEEDTPVIHVKENGTNETIIRYVFDEIRIQKDIYEEVLAKMSLENTPPSDDAKLLELPQIKVELNDISNKNLSYTNIEYYTLLAMASLYGGLISMFLTNKHQANISAVGKRTSISKIKKTTLLLSDFLVCYLVELIGIALIFLYTLFVLKADFGNKLLPVLIITAAGSLSGLALGVFISVVIKGTENLKTGVLIAFTMISSFFAGMYGITMKYVIDKNIPIINKINITSLITDGYYSLYYYNDLKRYLTNLIILVTISLILITISVINLRRKKYDSI